jgi:deazaflavin-dependent oxidoreductase (nitroreductase family)
VSWIEDLGAAEYCYLTTTGRRTGRPHRIEIWFVGRDDGAYLLAGSRGSDWYRNLGADPGVTLEIAGERRTTVAHAVPDDDPSNDAVRRAMVEKYQPGYGEDLTDWSRDSALVRVEWPPEG